MTIKYPLSVMILLCCILLCYSCESDFSDGASSGCGGFSGCSCDFTDDETGDDGQEGSNDNDIERPEGWGEASHGKDAEPDYDRLFPADQVKRIDIVIAAEQWQEMLDNMTELYGDFGSRPNNGMPGGGGGERPDGFEPPEGFPDGFEPPEGFPDGFEPPEGFPDDFEPPEGFPDDFEPPEGRPDDFPGGGGMGPGEFSQENPIWKPCTVTFEGKNWYHVGIRFKGNSSLMSSWSGGSYKLPFRFDFDEFEDDFPEIDNQRFFGFKKLSFSSNWSDNSFLREKLVADIFRDAGVPAPHTAFYRVYIDYGEGSKYFGLYTMVEVPHTPMLTAQFIEDDGNLYKPEGSGATFAAYDEASFDKETNKDEADFSDVLALYEAIQSDRSDMDAYRAKLESVFDVDGFLRWLAVNTVIQNWDTYGRMSHNYFLYNDPGDHLLHWIPWDNNMALDGGRSLSLELSETEVDEKWPLIRYLMDDSVCRAKYIGYVEETISSVFTPTRMQAIYAAAHEMIRPFTVGDEGEMENYTLLESAEKFDEELTYLNEHVSQRYQAAKDFVAENQ